MPLIVLFTLIRDRPLARPFHVVIACGGTGGHLFPGIAVAEELRGRGHEALLLISEKQVDREGTRKYSGLSFESVPAVAKPATLSPKMIPFLWRVWRTANLCRGMLRRHAIDAVLGMGGFTSLPPVYAGHRLGLPTFVHDSNAVPGRANRHLAGLADAIFVQWEETIGHFPPGAPVCVLGCPIRPGFNGSSRAAGIERFSLDAGRRTLLVTGASQGARTINEAVLANLDLLESLDDWQVLHLTGDRDHEQVRDAYRRRSVRHTVQAFTHHMAEALAAADLIVARAGASTLAEITAVGVPSILMPYPFHKDMHQLANARCLARASAARIVQDAIDVAVNGRALRRVLEQLMMNHEQRTAMAVAAQRMARGNAATDVADRILELAAPRCSAPKRPGMLGLEQTC